MTEKLELKVGEEYQIFDWKAEKSQTSFNGFYIGKNSLTTPRFSELKKPEGHTFVRDNEGQLEFYCIRDTENQGPKFVWYSDGDDGPEWPAGFKVDKVNFTPTKEEKQYLEERMKRYKKMRRVA